MVKRASFLDTFNFMFGVVLALGTLLYVGHDATGEIGKDPKSIRHQAVISTLGYVSTTLLLLSFALLVTGKVLLFGVSGLIEAEMAKETDRALQLEHEKERLMKLNENRKKGMLEDGLCPEAIAYNLKTEAEIEKLAKAHVRGSTDRELGLDYKPAKGISRIGGKRELLIRSSLFGAALFCAICTLTSCVTFFVTFLYKAEHVVLVVRMLCGSAMGMLAIAVVTGHALVMYTSMRMD